MNFLKIIFLTIILSLGFTGCGSGDGTATGDGSSTDGSANENSGPKEEGLFFEAGGLKLTAITNSPAYDNAELILETPPPGVDLAEGKNLIQFKVNNFTLGEQTPDAATKGLDNSDHGQHIHVLLNNAPYMAHYDAKIIQDMPAGHYVLVSFLSRSYHESVKSPNAFVARQFVVGQPESYKDVDLNAPHLFYSRSKGEYAPGKFGKLLLDFFLLNCTLSPDGYKVKATINGNEFLLTKWLPYSIEGLKAGEVKIKLELIDKEGKTVDSPFNPVERSVTLKANA